MSLNFPAELVIADAASMIFLSLGALFLLKFLLKFGSQKSKKYSVLLCMSVIAYAIFHEGAEIIYALYGIQIGFFEPAVTAALSLLYLAAALLLRNEMKLLIMAGGKRNGK